jgi:hypothetical protein
MTRKTQKLSPNMPGHNGGPPLEDKPHIPEWGKGGLGHYFSWKAAHRKAWRSLSPELMLRRLAKAEDIGLTYEEYSLEIMERGRYLQIEDSERIAQIKMARARSRQNKS